MPISSILGRLPLVPAGDHRTIPAAMRNSNSSNMESVTRMGAEGVAASFTTSTSATVGHALAL